MNKELKDERRELWYKIRISRFSFSVLLFLVACSIVLAVLIYFDQISYIIGWRLNRLEQQIADLIESSQKYDATTLELEEYRKKLREVKSERTSGVSALIAYREKLFSLRDEVNDFINNLKAYQRGYIAQIIRVIRNVLVNPTTSLSWEKADSGMKLQNGDKVKTGENSQAEISTESGNLLRVNPQSMIIVKDLSRDRNSFLPREVFSIRESGDADYNVRTRRSDLILEDDHAQINIKQQSDVKVNKRDRTSTISVFAGLVEVRNDKGTLREIRSREALSITSTGNFLETEKIPYPPELIEPLNLKVFRFKLKDTLEVILKWKSQEDINLYRLQVATDRDFNTKFVDEQINGLQYVLKDLHRGNYFWRVASVGGAVGGIQSEFTVTRSFLVTFDQDGDSDDIIPPTFLRLEVRAISQRAVIIEGKTEPGARLLADGITIAVGDDGAFSDIIPFDMNTGKSLELQLFDKTGNVNRKTVRPS